MNAKKNILFLFPDQHRGDWLPYSEDVFKKLGLPPIPLKMKNLKNLMDSGTTFIRAATNSPLCVPARACLASGKHYDHCGAYNNSFCYPLRQKTFYSILKKGGYRVGGVGKFDLHKPILFWNQDGWIDQLGTLGFTDAVDSEGKYDAIWSSFYEPRGPYTKFLHSKNLMKVHAKDYIKRYYNMYEANATSLPDFAYADNWVTTNALGMLKQFQSQRDPWFMMVNFLGPHDPWDVTQEMKKHFEDDQFPIPCNYDGDLAKINAVRQNYAAMLENIDRNIGLILKQLDESRELENTIIVYASDHGEMLGDHSRFFKCVPKRGAVHIPMIISGPGIRKGFVCDELVQLHDLAATFVDFAGLEMPEGTDAYSLKSLAMDGNASAIRDFQAVMLCNAFKYSGKHEGYDEYLHYQKQKTDTEYIDEFNKEFGLETSVQSASKMGYRKNWWCTITKKYKLVQFEDAEPELYNLQDDVFETRNIAETEPETVKRLKALYDFRIPKQGIMD